MNFQVTGQNVKSELNFSHTLNAKTFMFVLSYHFTEIRFLHKIFSKAAAMFLLIMC